MTSENTLAAFIKYSESLTESCKTNPKVIGLVLVGSTAETDRVDEWSDHDFFVITKSGDQESLRQDLSWLPRSEEIAFSLRETEHGLKVLYKWGGVLEFAIFDPAELRACTVNHYRLAFGDVEVESALAEAAGRLTQIVKGDDVSDFRLFLSVLVIQVGRARRGELITAGNGIRGTATMALLRVLTRRLAGDCQLDRLDVTRRFEFAHPVIGMAISSALAREPEEAAKELMRISDTYLAPLWEEYPKGNVQTIKEILSWNF